MNIRKRGIYLIGSAVMVMGLLTGCSSNDTVSEENKQIETEGQKMSPSEQTASEEVDNVIEISAFEMGYTPTSVMLEAGKEYTLVLKNDGEIFHDLTSNKLDVKITHMGDMPDHPEGMSFIDEIFGVKKAHASGNHEGGHEEDMNYIHMNAKPGQTVEIKFIPKETGKFNFYCSVPGHEEAGMHGKLEVK